MKELRKSSSVASPFIGPDKEKEFPRPLRDIEGLRRVGGPIVGKGTEGQAKGQKIRLASMSAAFPSSCVLTLSPSLKNYMCIL